MPRKLTNVSGQTRTLQDHTGRWQVIPPDGLLIVDDADERYYQTGECGETPIWADVATKTPSKTKTTTIEEAS